MRHREGDLLGDMLLVRRVSENRAVFRCQKCGAEKEYFISPVRQSAERGKRGCPVCRPKNVPPRRPVVMHEEIVGKRFGQLTVMDVHVGQIRRGAGSIQTAVALCRCGCGRTTEIPVNRLLQGGAKQCAECARKVLETGHSLMIDSHKEGTSVYSILDNRSLNKNSTTGHRGVSILKPKKKYPDAPSYYRAYIYFRRTQYHLGIFKDIKDAIAARKRAEKEIYGDFLSWYQENYHEEWERISKNLKARG
jgi:hypothetical protein